MPHRRGTDATARHLRWGVRALWTQLAPLLPGLAVEVVESAPSTNSELLARGRVASAPGSVGRRQADTQPCLLVAERQLAGRGRLGRSWTSEPGASLTFSLALALGPRDWSGLSLAVGVALADALQMMAAVTSPRVALKWPNDLWLLDGRATDGRKFGGVLIETLAAGERRLAVIGVGINVAPLSGPLPSDPARRGCLQEIAPHATAPAVLGAVALPLVQALQTFERDGFAAFAERFAAFDALRDEAIETSDPRCPAGTAHGVDGQGGLRIETAAGELRTIHSGEISVRPAGQPLPAPVPRMAAQ
jgi:BirA family biotin operon repressor/biotin-[acetyl-CoA-carboxylase] ligase